MQRKFFVPGLDALRADIRGAQDLAVRNLKDEIRGGSTEFVNGPIIYWTFVMVPKTLSAVATAERILTVNQKPVEFMRIEASPTNTAEILIGYQGVFIRGNALTDLLPGQGVNIEMDTNDYSTNQFVDAASFFAISSALGTLFVTLGYRDQRVQQL